MKFSKKQGYFTVSVIILSAAKMTVGAREDLFALQAKDHDRLVGRVLAGKGQVYGFYSYIWRRVFNCERESGDTVVTGRL